MKLEAHPFAGLIPEMLLDERVDLERDIKAHGQREPIILYEGKILDGRHRYAVCTKLGTEPKTTTFNGTEDEAKALVLSLNVHRRHLTFDQKQAIVKAELTRDPAQSDRTIAKAAKVDHKTVAKARKAAVRRGELPHVEKRNDTKGRAQPAKKTVTKVKPKSIDKSVGAIDVEYTETKRPDPPIADELHDPSRSAENWFLDAATYARDANVEDAIAAATRGIDALRAGSS